MTKEFKIQDVISVYTGILVGGVNGLYEVLNHLTGQKLFTHQLPRAAEECKKEIAKQLPFLESPEFDFDIALLKECLDSEEVKDVNDKKMLCAGWIIGQIAKNGETVELKPCPDSYNPMSPITELDEMRAGK